MLKKAYALLCQPCVFFKGRGAALYWSFKPDDQSSLSGDQPEPAIGDLKYFVEM